MLGMAACPITAFQYLRHSPLPRARARMDAHTVRDVQRHSSRSRPPANQFVCCTDSHAGDEYNRTSPPKKVDVMQAAVLEFKDRPDKPLYCVEHMIEGDYVSSRQRQSGKFAANWGRIGRIRTHDLCSCFVAFLSYLWLFGSALPTDQQAARIPSRASHTATALPNSQGSKQDAVSVLLSRWTLHPPLQVKYNSNSGFVATQPLASQPPSSRLPDSPTKGAASASASASDLLASSSNGPEDSPKKQQAEQQLLQLSRQPSNPLSRQSSGFADQAIRHTPQAFSHFTYSFTQGTALCVDIQGVADLYTDPQIHTLDGQGYGECAFVSP